MVGKTVASASRSMGAAAQATAATQTSAIVGDGLRTAGRPVAVAGLLPVAGMVSHALWGDPHTLPMALTGMSASSGALTWMTWRFSHDRETSAEGPTGNRAERRRARRWGRGMLRRWHLTVTTAAGLAWVELATVTGVFAHPTLDIWLIGGFTGAFAWVIRHHVHTGGGEGESDTWGARWRREIAEQVSLDGSTLRTLDDAGPRIETELTLAPGQSAEQVQQAREGIAHAFDVPTRAVRALPSTESARRVRLTVVAGDLLAKALPWPGPSRPGGSVAEPLRFARYEDWRDAELTFPHTALPDGLGDLIEKIAFHLLIAGMTGAGKSAAARCLIAELITRTDVVIWIADIVKKWQTFGAAAPAVDWFATDKPTAAAMLSTLPGIIAARADYLGRHGYDNWEPGCGIPYMVVLLEEGAALLSGGNDDFVRAAEQARSVGLTLIVSIQRPSYRTMPIEARQQFGGALCHGVKSDADARFVLDDLVDAGANPEQWGTKRPGYAYLTVPGVDEDRHTVPLRSFKISRGELAALATEWADRRPALDDLSARAAGQAYATRSRITDPVLTDDDPGPQQADDERGWTPPTEHDVVDGEVLARKDAAMPDPQFVAPTNPDPDLTDLPLDSPLDAGAGQGRMPFGTTTRTPEMEISAARALLDDAIDQFAALGREFAPRDLRTVVKATGRNRDWLMRELRDRVKTGRLIRMDDGAGNYRIPNAA